MNIKWNIGALKTSKYKKQSSDEYVECTIHDQIDDTLFFDYVKQRILDGDDLTVNRVQVMVKLLHRAIENGYSPNDLLMIAIAGNYRTPVYEQHLQPKQSLTE